MAATLVQLGHESVSVADGCVAQIAELAGLKVSFVTDIGQALVELQAVKRGCGGPVVLAASGLTMMNLYSATDPARQDLLKQVRALASFFVYGFPQTSGAELLRHLSGLSESTPLESLPAGKINYEFSETIPPPLAGLSFTYPADQAITVFSNGEPGKKAQVLLKANAQPLLIANSHSGAKDYLLSHASVISVDAPLVPPRIANDYQGEILPTALALKQMFAEYCWHNPFPTACFLVDDPWLRSRYGYFKYDDVLAELGAGNYAATVAFISSNYGRNDPRVVAQVARHADRFSICVHGCDHTGGEFGETNKLSIEGKAAGAMDNMVKLQNSTGLRFDPVMVFPQGVYSSTSPVALKHCGYLAAVNTEPYPTDYALAPVKIADIFDLAIMRYDSFPIFTRHYPKRVFDFAVDLFWGKPVLVVEHHEYFEQGASRVTEFVNQLRHLDPRLEWLPLEKALIRSGHYRLIEPGSYAVKFVTAVFRVRNPSPQRARFDCRKPETEPERIQAVLLDQQTIAYDLEAGCVCLKFELEPEAERTITIQYKPCQVRRMNRPLKYKLKALVRRRLSEIRDNHLSKNGNVLGFAKRMKRWLRA